jgi:hypothetical protein
MVAVLEVSNKSVSEDNILMLDDMADHLAFWGLSFDRTSVCGLLAVCPHSYRFDLRVGTGIYLQVQNTGRRLQAS